MTTSAGNNREPADESIAGVRATSLAAFDPRTFGAVPGLSSAADPYLRDPSTRKLIEFFENKGLAALKREDQSEQWYDDWLAYQAEHQIYASVLSPSQYSKLGNLFDLVRYARFLEVFGYFSPAHGYSVQVSFLGLIAILMGENDALKHEAVGALERGEVLAFGVSEKPHGADLLGNDFVVEEVAPGRLVANGSKYYIGNANVAAMIAVLAKQTDARSDDDGGRRHAKRSPMVLFALRPAQSKGFGNVQKIRTLGVRAAFVGAFEVKDHEVPEADVIAQGRHAWDAIFGAVTLGKFFLNFGSIGICEHALAEAIDHLNARILYGKPASAMTHIRAALAQAYARLAAMKLYAYRSLDYVHAANADDRRFLLFCAVQKAKVSTEGVKVISLLSECVGAKGFEADMYFEMALRDVQLFPSLEGSAHINLAMTMQFAARYFGDFDRTLADPESLHVADVPTRENPYLLEARTGAINRIAFPPYLRAYRPLRAVANVRRFARQVKAFWRLFRALDASKIDASDLQLSMILGQCMATIVYGQLIAENSKRLDLPAEMLSAMFHMLVSDLSNSALALGAFPGHAATGHRLARRVVSVPRTPQTDWDFVTRRMAGR